jgi:hypothetical protein
VDLAFDHVHQSDRATTAPSLGNSSSLAQPNHLSQFCLISSCACSSVGLESRQTALALGLLRKYLQNGGKVARYVQHSSAKLIVPKDTLELRIGARHRARARH